MSKLRYLEKLLDGAGVESKTLGWIGEVRMCKRILKKQTSHEGDIPFFKIGTFGKEPNAYISRDIFEEYRDKYHYPKVGEVLISASGTIGRAVIFDGEESYFQDSNIVWIENDESKVLNRYLFHFYGVAKWHVSDGGVISRLYNDNIKMTPIPIPCPNNPQKSLAIQTEIARILDSFTALTTELITELSLRQKQYQYYRDLLLDFDDSEVEWKPLADLVNLRRGKRLVKSQLGESGNYPVYQNSMKPLGFYHEGNVKSDTVFIISAGAAGEIGYSKIDFWAADDVYICLTTSVIYSKFLYYCLLNQQEKILGQVRRASIPRLSKIAIEKLLIPIPCPDNPQESLSIQAEIVCTLDKFDTLTNSISVGLPREIELRQKQYEYYRDLLLSFD